MYRFLVIVFIIDLSALAGYSFFVKSSVAAKARDIAGSQPYCIWVEGSSGPRLATGFTDTLGLWMLGNKAYPHASLVVGYRENPIRYNWSYWNNDFMPAESVSMGRSCGGWKYDIETLSAADYKETKILSLGTKDYAVPVVYRPWESGDNRFVVSIDLSTYQPTHSINGYLISLEQQATVPLKLGYGHDIDDASSLTLSPQDFHEPYGDYFARDVEGKIITLIECAGSSVATCSHSFDRNGVRYSLRYLPKDLTKWKQREEAVSQLIEGFEIIH